MNVYSNQIAFWMNGRQVEIDFSREGTWRPTTTVLQYLRSLPDHKGTKEGCAEGDCGACTVVVAEPDSDGKLQYRAIDSCLVFLPMIHGKQLITVEHLGTSENLHPVQQAMVDCDGSQCGYCTPGFIMSLFALYKSGAAPDRPEVMDALTGNLCRCTGYRSIVQAAERSCTGACHDHFSENEPHVCQKLQALQQEKADVSITDQSGNTYLRPSSLAEAVAYRAAHPSALIVCGGTDVGLMVTKKKLNLPQVLDLSGVRELQDIAETVDGLRLGATLSLERVKAASKGRFPALYDMLAVFGSRQIREQATLGGNLANASPIGDTPPVLMALDASVEVTGASGSRVMKVSEFITGYRTTALRPDELISAVIIPPTPAGRVVKSYKISKRKDLDISTASGGFWLELDGVGAVKDIGLVYGGMAAMTKRAVQAEEFLLGKPWTRENVEAAMDLIDAEFTPISDARSGKEGRRLMARNLLLKFWSDTIQMPHVQLH
ncbi:MAG: xanthine dehydrogenase small subunit [Bacteroidia bacterium]